MRQYYVMCSYNTKKMNAEEFLKQKYDELGTIECLKEFAKMKVLEAVELIKDNVQYGIYQNDDGQEPFHHESNIFVDERTIDDAFDIDELCK